MGIRLNHAGVVVRDLEKAVTFYRDVIGLEVMERLDRIGPEIDQVVGYENSRLLIAKMNAPSEDHLVELIQYVRPEPLQRHSEERSQIGASHIAFFVDDIDDKFNAI
ncbi:MAG: VOC family protein, partial [SAR202 cluster bacterium]|nr:VOC family protein [SAR202 cluster bacterium]